jgi:hypothetical protein
MARDAAYVLVALALCCAMFVVVHQIYVQQRPPVTPPRVYSMLELKEFKDLPAEFKMMIRKTMPDPNLIRKQWGSMTPDHKKAVLEKVSNGGMIPFPEEVPPPVRPAPAQPMKKGFLLKQDKKKNPKNKENDEVVTLRAVKTATVIEEGTEETDGLASNDGDTTFLGSDD